MAIPQHQNVVGNNVVEYQRLQIAVRVEWDLRAIRMSNEEVNNVRLNNARVL